MEYKKGDVVELTIRRCDPTPNPRIIGKFEATVSDVWPSKDGQPLEVSVVPTSWDEACDLLAREGSMSWTEIAELRDTGVLENVQVDDDLRLVRRPLDVDQVHAAVDAQLEQMWINLADEFGLQSGDVDPVVEWKWTEETRPAIYDYVYSWYTGNQPA